MMGLDLIPQDIRQRYICREWRHAIAILAADFPQEWADIKQVLHGFKLKRSHIEAGGGGRSLISQSLDEPFYRLGWDEKKFRTSILVDDVQHRSPTHLVDCFKGKVALEIEWSNKDPFFDRDLNNFRLLFELRAASVGVIITKSLLLRPLVREIDRVLDIGKTDPRQKNRIYKKYGSTTTWLKKLLPRIEGGGGGGCPLVVFAITPQSFVDDVTGRPLNFALEPLPPDGTGPDYGGTLDEDEDESQGDSD